MIPQHPGDFGKGRFYFGTSNTSQRNWMPIFVPDEARWMEVFLHGPGGSGGAGASAASGTQRGGGGGGGEGGNCYIRIPTAFIPKTVFLSLGGSGSTQNSVLAYVDDPSAQIMQANVGGTGGTGTTTANGAAGGASSASVIAYANVLGGKSQNGSSGAAGGLGNAAGGTVGTIPWHGTGGSGGGGALSAGQFGGAINFNAPSVKLVPSALQVAPGLRGRDGWRLMHPFPIFSGGSGGGSSDTGTGGDGGSGGPGSGGGGGGAGVTGGAGGLGGEGWAWVMFS